MSIFALTFIIVFLAQVLSLFNYILLKTITGYGQQFDTPVIPTKEMVTHIFTSLMILFITSSLIAAYALSWFLKD